MNRFLLILIILLSLPGSLFSQEIRELSSLHYTYMGPVFTLSYDKVEHKDWFETEQGVNKMTGTTFSGGIALQIYVERFIGDFHLKYARSNYDSSLNLAEAVIAGKYLWPLRENISAGAGLGIYSETGMPGNDYKGSAGIHLPLTFVFTPSYQWKLFCDLFFRYGSFGLGEGSSKFCIGTSLGVVYRVGRI